MDWHAAIGIAAGILQVASIVPYIRDMLRGSTRPNIISWALWTILQVISVFAQLSTGLSWSVLLIMAATFNTTLVLVLCLFGYGYKKYGIIEWFCTFLALAAIALWYFFNNPVAAILLGITADLSASIPTIVKSYKDPYSETAVAWFMTAMAGGLSILSVTEMTIANLAWPIYFFVGSGLITVLIFFGQRTQKRP